MSKEFKGHESCPECGSEDNVGVWSDGQKWCFGCGYYIPANGMGLSVEELWKRIREQKEKRKYKKNAHITLPFDYSIMLPEKAEQWLDQYGITDAEKINYRIGWSDFYESLIFSAFDVWGNLLVVQRRYMGSRTDIPKYHTKGYPESVIWSVYPNGDESPTVGNVADTYNGDIVLVEDYISAIKVGRHLEVSPLWGSQLSLDKLRRMAARWEKVIFWLDANKLKDAMLFKDRCLPYFKYANVIFSEKDPKCYDDDQIRAFLLDS